MVLIGKSDIGRKRSANEDSMKYLALADNAALLVVCDGMGGAVGGSCASSLAAETFLANTKDVLSSVLMQGGTHEEIIQAASQCLADGVAYANAAVFAKTKEDPSLNGMGTTLIAAFVYDNTVVSINVGDSRLYHISSDEIRQLSHDHSYVQYLIDCGKITPEDARISNVRNIITRSIGVEENVEADLLVTELGNNTAGSMLLLCSDGLYNELDDMTIHFLLNVTDIPLEMRVQSLIDYANSHNGADNITAVLLAI